METTEVIYPVFEANQVLSNAPLNDMREYLDEQTRLTRADLIGIGIVCGLEATLDPGGSVRLSRGCGVTSQGYLVVEPADLALVQVRRYTLPLEVGYQPFMVPGGDPATQYGLWELFDDDDEPGAMPLATSGLPLQDMAVVLFLELRRDRTRNCSPKGCDDRGSEVTTTVRRLLIDAGDLRKVIEAGRSAGPIPLGVDVAGRLQLPDLRMPRFDVPNTAPVSAERVLAGFQAVFRKNGLAGATAAALTSLYLAFEPLVRDDYPSGNPFAQFGNRFGFLDSAPVTVGQVRFMQYYWDLFDDLLAAYDEVRAKGIDLLCACCPPQGLFPRHLVAGVLAPDDDNSFEYRTRFVPSPAVSSCADRSREVRVLFRRLVTMLSEFTETPGDKGIRATPSSAAVPLSRKAIPYYYRQDGAPPLYQVWNPDRARALRANQNLGYHADEYTPAAPAFVTDPLRFDLEPHDFLRIEGHLGKDVHTALESLLTLRRRYRLPFDVIALRTGVFDENMTVDLDEERCRFRDLETLYEALGSELVCFLVKQVVYFYSLPLADPAVGQQPITPTLPLLKARAPDFLAQPGTLGHAIESIRNWAPGRPRPFVFAGAGVPHLPSQATALTTAMSDLADLLTDDIRDLDVVAFDRCYRTLVDIARRMDDARREGVYDEPGLSDRLDDIVFRCRLDPFDALAEEYRRRVREVKQEQFLSTFLERHPGIQHKAGVPLGGTFILVYHQRPASARGPVLRPGLLRGAGIGVEGLTASRLWAAMSRLGEKEDLRTNVDVRTIRQILPALIPQLAAPVGDITDRIYAGAVAELPDGTVIADFFLPYGCRSDCPPIQYQLPPTRLRVTTSKTCTNAQEFAEVTLGVEGAIGDLSVQIDHGAFEALPEPLVLGMGEHTIVVRDATGNESSPVTVKIPAPLAIRGTESSVDDANGTYRVMFTIAGGTPQYIVNVGSVVGTTYTSPALELAQTLTVTVTDAAGCTVTGTFDSGVQPCDFPCDGAAVREGFRFWLPEARPDLPIDGFGPGLMLELRLFEVRSFTVTAPDGTLHDVTQAVGDLLGPVQAPIGSDDFVPLVQEWLAAIDEIVAGALGSPNWFHLEYGAAAGAATTGTLFVDRIECVGFSFEIAVSFTQGRSQRHFQFVYSPEGTIAVEPGAQSKLRIPVFDVSTSNRCRPGEPAVPRCEGTDLQLEIRRDDAVPGSLTFGAAVAGGDLPVAFLWELQDGIPSLAGGERVAVVFQPVEPTTKLVRLTAFTEKGCTVTVEQHFDIAAG